MRPLAVFLLLTVACRTRPLDTAIADGDGDGYGELVDCDDDDASVHPGASEVPYDGADNDCDGSTPDDDLDGDGYLGDVDCDDLDPAINQGATEICNDVDDDCDGLIDDGALSSWYADGDGDGYGDPGSLEEACEAESGQVADGSDCDDEDAGVNPGAGELCNGVDDDCDEEIDEDGALDPETWYPDDDGDGYGVPTGATEACDQPEGYSAVDTDCDDTRALTSPGADETCNEIDDDCDEEVDEDDAVDAATWYIDYDGDGFGAPTYTSQACTQPTGYAADDSDCDDTDGGSYPGAAEVCGDGADNDCDGVVDDGC